MLNSNEPELLTPSDAAKFLGRTEGTLAVWRCTKRYNLPYTRSGYRIMYYKSDLVEFLEARKVTPHKPVLGGRRGR